MLRPILSVGRVKLAFRPPHDGWTEGNRQGHPCRMRSSWAEIDGQPAMGIMEMKDGQQRSRGSHLRTRKQGGWPHDYEIIVGR